MRAFRLLVSAAALCALVSTETIASPLASAVQAGVQAASPESLITNVQSPRPVPPRRAAVAPVAPVARGAYRGGRYHGGGGGYGGAAAAAVGLGILGAVIATEAARAQPQECWLERQ